MTELGALAMTILCISSHCTEASGFSKIRLSGRRGGGLQLPVLPEIRDHLVQHHESRSGRSHDKKHANDENDRTIATRLRALGTARGELEIEGLQELFWRCR